MTVITLSLYLLGCEMGGLNPVALSLGCSAQSLVATES